MFDYYTAGNKHVTLRIHGAALCKRPSRVCWEPLIKTEVFVNDPHMNDEPETPATWFLANMIPDVHHMRERGQLDVLAGIAEEVVLFSIKELVSDSSQHRKKFKDAVLPPTIADLTAQLSSARLKTAGLSTKELKKHKDTGPSLNGRDRSG